MSSKTNDIQRSLGFYNALPNFLWSALSLVPLCIYCSKYVNRPALLIFILISLIPIFFRKSFLDNLQISRSTRIYKLLKVNAVNKIAQNGAMINALMQRKYPGYKVVTSNRKSVAKLISQTYMFERFHWIWFIFFTLVTGSALVQGQFYWAGALTVLNILYNVYPNLLQQYLRVKMKGFSSRETNPTITISNQQ